MKLQCKVYREVSVFYFNSPFSDVPSFPKISQPSGYNQQIGKQFCLPPLSFKINLRDTSFHISLNSFGFYLSPEYLLNFLWLVYSTMFGEKFSNYGDHLPRKCIESKVCIFTHAPVPPVKRNFWKYFSPRRKGWRKLWFALFCWNMEMTCNICLLIFFMICNFSKCDSFTVLWIISIK